jgi:hypothetical protein
MKKLLLIILCLPIIGLGQDNIILKDGEEISSKILRINEENIEYKKSSNLQGPTYTLDKTDVFMIKYENGEKEVFSEKESYDKNSSKHDDLLSKLTKKNNIVYIESEDDGARIHATNAIKSWGYFQITEDEQEADLVLRFMGNYNGAAHWSTYVQFINPIDGEILKSTKAHHDVWGWDVNSKRGAVKKLIDREIKSVYY